MTTRTESDSLGKKEVPSNAYYGIHTARSIENFSGFTITFSQSFYKAIATIKKCCAQANESLQLLEASKSKAIQQSADEIIDSKFSQELCLSIFQAGSGTSTNMNVNEVIANRACEILGKQKGSKFVHPNDDVNKGQSTNDVFPTSTKLALLDNTYRLLKRQPNMDLLNALEEEAISFRRANQREQPHLITKAELEARINALEKEYLSMP